MSDDRNDPEHNPLADQLADLDVDVSEGDDRPAGETDAAEDDSTGADDPLSDEELFRRTVDNLEDDEIPAAGADPGPPPEQTGRDRSEPRRTDAGTDDSPDEEIKSDRELFEEAVEDLDPAEMYEGKYKGSSGTSSQLPDDQPPVVDHSDSGAESSSGEPDENVTDERQRRQQVQQLRDEALFHKMVGDVDPLEDRDKYHEARSHGHNRDRRAEPDDERSLITPSLPRSGDGLHYVPPLGDAQKAMLKRHERFSQSNHVPVLNVRGMTRTEALDRLREFMDRHHRDDEIRFVRLVPGRGLQSDDEPVLKPAVLEWLEGPGREMIRGYVPERVHSGDYGSLVVELKG